MFFWNSPRKKLTVDNMIEFLKTKHPDDGYDPHHFTYCLIGQMLDAHSNNYKVSLQFVEWGPWGALASRIPNELNLISLAMSHGEFREATADTLHCEDYTFGKALERAGKIRALS